MAFLYLETVTEFNNPTPINLIKELEYGYLKG